MKKILTSILLLSTVCGLSQQSNTLRVRKPQYDTSFYTMSFLDSVYRKEVVSIEIDPILGTKRIGYWEKNIFFDTTSVVIFSSTVSKRKKRLAQKKPDAFWKKMNRKIKRNKIEVFRTNYAFIETDTYFNKDSITYTHYQLRNKETGQITRDETMIIKSDTSSTTFSTRSYQYISSFDTLSFGDITQNQFFCSGSANYQHCLFRALVKKLKNTYKNEMPYGHFKLSNRIDNNRYSMFLNFESHLSKKAIFIENGQNRQYVEFEITNDSIYIPNSPFGIIYGGKIARKKKKIRFKSENKNYTFYYKKPNKYYPGLGKFTVEEYYQYPIAKN